jgi:hypothetical protein
MQKRTEGTFPFTIGRFTRMMLVNVRCVDESDRNQQNDGDCGKNSDRGINARTV